MLKRSAQTRAADRYGQEQLDAGLIGVVLAPLSACNNCDQVAKNVFHLLYTLSVRTSDILQITVNAKKGIVQVLLHSKDCETYLVNAFRDPASVMNLFDLRRLTNKPRKFAATRLCDTKKTMASHLKETVEIAPQDSTESEATSKRYTYSITKEALSPNSESSKTSITNSQFCFEELESESQAQRQRQQPECDSATAQVSTFQGRNKESSHINQQDHVNDYYFTTIKTSISQRGENDDFRVQKIPASSCHSSPIEHRHNETLGNAVIDNEQNLSEIQDKENHTVSSVLKLSESEHPETPSNVEQHGLLQIPFCTSNFPNTDKTFKAVSNVYTDEISEDYLAKSRPVLESADTHVKDISRPAEFKSGTDESKTHLNFGTESNRDLGSAVSKQPINTTLSSCVTDSEKTSSPLVAVAPTTVSQLSDETAVLQYTSLKSNATVSKLKEKGISYSEWVGVVDNDISESSTFNIESQNSCETGVLKIERRDTSGSDSSKTEEKESLSTDLSNKETKDSPSTDASKQEEKGSFGAKVEEIRSFRAKGPKIKGKDSSGADVSTPGQEGSPSTIVSQTGNNKSLGPGVFKREEIGKSEAAGPKPANEGGSGAANTKAMSRQDDNEESCGTTVTKLHAKTSTAEVGPCGCPETVFYHQGQHIGTESRHAEFKRGGVVWQQRLFRNMVGKYMCGFLNSEGGTIYFGVTDDGKVLGIQADAEMEETLRRDIDFAVISLLEPSVHQEEYSVNFARIMDPVSGQLSCNLKVLQLCVKPRASTSRRGQLRYSCNNVIYIRRDGSLQALRTHNTRAE